MIKDENERLNIIRKGLEEKIENLEIAEKELKEIEEDLFGTHRDILMLEEQGEKYSYDKGLVPLIQDAYKAMHDERRAFENITDELKAAKLESMRKLDSVNEELKCKGEK